MLGAENMMINQTDTALDLMELRSNGETDSNKTTTGRVWWLTPTILALWKAEVGVLPEEFETSLGNVVKLHLY